jgi:hypothetical protein
VQSLSSNSNTSCARDVRIKFLYWPSPLTTITDRSPGNPVVFCHGLLGFDSVTIGPAIAPVQVTHWRGIKEVLEANGTEVLITRVPATSSPVDRAKVLEQKISKVYPGRSVHLIGPSPVIHIHSISFLISCL